MGFLKEGASLPGFKDFLDFLEVGSLKVDFIKDSLGSPPEGGEESIS
jgi:hypothetical protein